MSCPSFFYWQDKIIEANVNVSKGLHREIYQTSFPEPLALLLIAANHSAAFVLLGQFEK